MLFNQVLAKPDILITDKDKKEVYLVDFNKILKTAIDGETTFVLEEKNKIPDIKQTVMVLTHDGKKGIFIQDIKGSWGKEVMIMNMKTKEKGEPIRVKEANVIHITPNNEYALLFYRGAEYAGEVNDC
jgi:hypothetical protein